MEKAKIFVTDLVKQYSGVFDVQFWSTYKALERLLPADVWKEERKKFMDTRVVNKKILTKYEITQEQLDSTCADIKTEWQKKSDEAAERGIKIHAQIEQQFKDPSSSIDLKAFGIGGIIDVPICNISTPDLPSGVYSEYPILVDCGDIILSGRIDLLVRDGNDIYIVDHKTNNQIKNKGVYNGKKHDIQKMKFPLNDLEDTTFNHYSMQLSIYAWMLQQLFKDIQIKELIINHFGEGNKHEFIHCDYMKEHVEKLMNQYQKKIKHKTQLDKLKPFEY